MSYDAVPRSTVHMELLESSSAQWADVSVATRRERLYSWSTSGVAAHLAGPFGRC